MAVAVGQICAEKWLHSSAAWYIYQPTGAGDWFRWRLVTAAAIGIADTTYPCIAGCSRGQVYAGAQKLSTDHDATTGFAVGTDAFGSVVVRTATAITAYRDYNLPTGMTHCRVILRAVASNDGISRLSALDASDNVLGYQDTDPNVGACLFEGAWFAIPAGTAKIRYHKAADDSKTIRMIGLDFINISSPVDPDTAGSVMYCGNDVVGSSVIRSPAWDYVFAGGPSSHEMALYWSDTGDAYSASNACGGIGHRGIDTATIAWQTQSGTDAAAEWAPDPGAKTPADFLIMGITTAKVYRETAKTNYRGTLTGKLLFDASGCLIDYNVAVDQGTDMDVFQFYTMQLAFPLYAARYVYFHGDESVNALGAATITTTVKTSKLELWGGNNGVHYTLENLQPDTQEYYQTLAAASFPRVTYNTTYWKAYANRYQNVAAAWDVNNGSAVSTRFAIRLKDRKLSQKRIVRLL